jgi:RHS repeat-associated protein
VKFNAFRSRRVALVVLAFGGLALPAMAGQPIQVALQNSRLASFDINCFLYCFPSDDLTINVQIISDTQAQPGTYHISLGGVPFATFTVGQDHKLANPDNAGNPYVQTFVYGPVSSSGNLGILIIGDNLVTYSFNYPIIVNNQFVFEFFWTFLGIPATFTLHPVRHYSTTISVFIGNPPDTDPPPGCQSCPNCTAGKTGMASYSFNAQQAGLVLSDTPISYNPPRGSPMSFALTYNQRDVNQPAVFSSSNVGSQWTFNGLTYISAGPVTGQIEAVRYLPGGGQERYRSYTQASANPAVFDGYILNFIPHPNSQAVLQALTNTALGNRPNFYQLTFPDGTVETYDNNAGGGTTLYITKRVDPQGNTTTYTYAPSSAQLLSITDALGQVTTFTYGLVSDGLKITKVTDPFGRSASLTYDNQGRLASITDPVGIVSSFTYDATGGYVKTLTTPYGTTTFLVQDGLGSRMVQATDPLGQTERLEYQNNLPFLPATEAAVPSATGLTINNTNLNSFNSFYWGKKAYADAIASGASPGSPAFYNFAKQTHWALGLRGVTATPSSEKMPLESRVWYNYQGQTNPDYIDPTATTLPAMTARLLDDGSTQVYQKTYNANGYVTQSIDPVGRETDSVYAANGQDVIQTTQKNSASNEQLFAATYNTIHLPLTTTDAAGQTTTTTYNAFGQPLTIANPKSEVTTMVYDGNGYLQTVTGAIPGSTTTYTYDTAGRVQTVTDSEGYTVTNAYDNLDRLTKQTFPDATFRQTVYDRLSIGSTTDRLGRTTTYTNDGLGRVIQIKDPLNRIVSQSWCPCGSIKTLQDGKGNATTWNYDTQGRLTSKMYADGKGDTFFYETSTSRLKSKTDALNQTTTYGYARDNNLLSITYTNAKNPTPNVSFAYDLAYNRRISMTDGTGTTTYAYNPVNGAIGAGKLQSVAGPLPNSTITYTYDELGRVVSRSINGSANQMSMTYDALGRVISEMNPLGTFTTAYVDQTARPSSLTYPNGQSTLYSYFNNLGDQRLQEIKNLSGASVLSQFDYTYDAEGQILTWAQQTSSLNTFALGYDLAGQLTTANRTGVSPQSFAYAYDAAANRTNETIGGAAAPVTVNSLNELVSRTGSNPRSFAYDADGNLISNNGTARSSTNYTFQWDAENRLIAINYPTTNQRSEFTYDGLGRRVKIMEKTGATITSTKQFVWDGAAEAEERDGSGGLSKRFYSEGQVNGTTALFYTRDRLGSVREMLNSAQILQARYDYDPYGRRTLLSGTDVADFGFTDHYVHSPSKLHLALYRSYDADSGRWLSRDPIAENGDPLNVYRYALANPAAYIDPLGLDIWVENTREGFGFHQRVCADVRDCHCKTTGKYCIGWGPNHFPAPIEVTDARVYEDNIDPVTSEYVRYGLTCKGDLCAVAKLKRLVGWGVRNGYSLCPLRGQVCRDFAQDAARGISGECGKQ